MFDAERSKKQDQRTMSDNHGVHQGGGNWELLISQLKKSSRFVRERGVNIH